MEPGRDHAMTNTTDDHHGLPSQPATTTAASTAPLTQPEDVPQESDAQSIGAFSTGLSVSPLASSTPHLGSAIVC